MAPPIEPGIHDKNSNPVMALSAPNLDKFLSRVAAPTSITLSSFFFIKANLGVLQMTKCAND